jgi:hypothetical protein
MFWFYYKHFISEMKSQFQPHIDMINTLEICERNGRTLVISASSDCSVAVYDFLGKKIGVCGQVFIYIVILLYYMSSCFNSNFQRCTTLCDKVCRWLATGRWFSLGLPFFSTNKTDRHDITKILLKVVLITIKEKNK